MKFQRDDIIEAMTNTASEAWESLEKPWQECLNLAWEAHSLSTVPVGAVLVDPDQNIVATGGNGVIRPAQPAGNRSSLGSRGGERTVASRSRGPLRGTYALRVLGTLLAVRWRGDRRNGGNDPLRWNRSLQRCISFCRKQPCDRSASYEDRRSAYRSVRSLGRRPTRGVLPTS